MYFDCEFCGRVERVLARFREIAILKKITCICKICNLSFFIFFIYPLDLLLAQFTPSGAKKKKFFAPPVYWAVEVGNKRWRLASIFISV